MHVLNPGYAARMPAYWTPMRAEVASALKTSTNGQVPYQHRGVGAADARLIGGQPPAAGSEMTRMTLNMAVRATAPIGPAPVTTTVAPDEGSWAIAVL